jgi:hypothetical protein
MKISARFGLLALFQIMLVISLAYAADTSVPGRGSISGNKLAFLQAAMNADGANFVTAEITGLEPVQTEAGTVLNVKGTIDASEFKRAWLQIGEGEKPDKWKYVGQKRKYAIHDGVLSVIPLGEFTDSGVWQVIVHVENRNGTRKSATYPIRIK